MVMMYFLTRGKVSTKIIEICILYIMYYVYNICLSLAMLVKVSIAPPLLSGRFWKKKGQGNSKKQEWPET